MVSSRVTALSLTLITLTQCAAGHGQSLRLRVVLDSVPTPGTFEEYAAYRIGRMKRTCDLSVDQVAALSLAAKGVGNRLKQKIDEERRAHRASGRRVPSRCTRKVLADHRIQLLGDPRWFKTVARVLTDRQKARWDRTQNLEGNKVIRAVAALQRRDAKLIEREKLGNWFADTSAAGVTTRMKRLKPDGR